ncbi:dipeptidyl aminopeptidase/acylaminoacyl peptidase [Pontibacter ummariensis]|uniref:Dipeptidyl aminopeptidase/acylaminoacyl peptidase n=1 Tax=Pontibacter ummariensis TaxID=1610492 RepID=A0A239ILH6_9BACT|nr:S9 family peptidase [Pontibacter ummariensis]PRY09885.1 dipeptidyl aminopeptidase/acylaminoacyl peptidase [Pontibacter ummariensis]SNS93903.1 Dipeptidyl aminopeptidase/acylaminoacyl peptidase [Pontibacter ummariensis]
MNKRLLFVLSAALLGGTTMAQKQPMTTDDGLNMTSLGNAIISPDGKSVIYGKSELNWEKNKRETTYHYVSSIGGESYQYLGEDGGSDLSYSPDGKYIALKRKADDHQQLFLLPTAGGEAIQLTKHENSVGKYVWSKDSKKLYFVSSVPRNKEAQKLYKAGNDALFVDEGPNGQTEGAWEHLWVFDLNSKKAKKLTKNEQLIGDFDVAPDGKRIVYTGRQENRRNQRNLSEIYLLQLSGDTATVQLTNNKAPEGDLSWAPDGKSFAYTAADDKEWELRNDKIWVMDPNTKQSRMVSGKFEGNISNYYWAPDARSILFTGLQRTNTNLYRLHVAKGDVKNLSNRTGTWRILGITPDRNKAVLSFSDYKTPTDLYVSGLDKFNPTKLTNLNPRISDSLQLATAEVVQWKSKDGLEVEGLLYLPTDYQKGKQHPFLLHIHGGPAGVFTNSFNPAYHVWANLGYVQLAPNVRGSSGYTDALLRGNMGDIGGGDYEDLMSGVDKLVAEGMVDKEKMAVRGWSYGGILGGTTITKTTRFKAASLGAMVSDWASEYGIGFNHDVRLWYIQGTPWENPEGYRQKSVLTHAKNIQTPTLILHGLSDVTDTEAQSMMLFTALKDMGKTVRYIQFPREPHGFREPRHQRIRDIEEIKWIQKHTLGIDWQAPERKEDAKKKPEEKAQASAK